MKEPKIFRMDWKALGYDPVWENGKLIWVKSDLRIKETKNVL
jgi:hypothetical protein